MLISSHLNKSRTSPKLLFSICTHEWEKGYINNRIAINSLRTDGNLILSPRVGQRNCPKNVKLMKPTDMTKAFEEHFFDGTYH
jgi:hypothetical protein